MYARYWHFCCKHIDAPWCNLDLYLIFKYLSIWISDQKCSLAKDCVALLIEDMNQYEMVIRNLFNVNIWDQSLSRHLIFVYFSYNFSSQISYFEHRRRMINVIFLPYFRPDEEKDNEQRRAEWTTSISPLLSHSTSIIFLLYYSMWS